MKVKDYINSLIEEKESLKSACKAHVETIRFMKRELVKNNDTISKKDKKILKLENELNLLLKNTNINASVELESVKNELNMLKSSYEDLKNMYDDILIQKQKSDKVNTKHQNNKRGELKKLKDDYNDLKQKYDAVVKENEELMRIFDEAEQTFDSN